MQSTPLRIDGEAPHLRLSGPFAQCDQKVTCAGSFRGRLVFISYILERKVLGSLGQAAVYFFEVEYTTAVKGLPHSKQLAFNRGVINPQDGHILCDRNPATCGFSLRIQRNSRIVKRTISRPKEILVAFIKATFLASARILGLDRGETNGRHISASHFFRDCSYAALP
jgi:hypothetical protein